MSTHPRIDRYWRIITSSVRLHELKTLDAPAIIIRNEYRVFNDALVALQQNENLGQAAKVRTRPAADSMSTAIRSQAR
ncbi:MAG: hypothetical protein ACR2QL_02010 [Woeseiaceae bacterium]